ncbi:hypothetical protein DIZ76_014866 [Coccidioides immitis]|nr:hypothetical protein DIZ76_014866 [Coccidioides immitis]
MMIFVTDLHHLDVQDCLSGTATAITSVVVAIVIGKRNEIRSEKDISATVGFGDGVETVNAKRFAKKNSGIFSGIF